MYSLELKKIGKKYGKQVALQDISLSIAPGERVVVFAPSGSGKTVLLRIIAGMEEPDSGEIFISGMNHTHTSPNERPVGMAFQNFALFPHMSAFKNLQSPLDSTNIDAEEKSRRVNAMAKLLKIDHVLDHMPKELSNGQKQRVSLGRALVNNPNVLILDDPLRNVDAKLRFEMLMEFPKLLKESNSSVVYVTQDYKEAMMLGDRVVVLMQGNVIQVDTPAKVYSSPETLEVAKLFGDPMINLFDARLEKSEEGVFANFGDVKVFISDSYLSQVGKNVILGIRPHDFKIGNASHFNSFKTEILEATPINMKILLLAKLDNQKEFLILTSKKSESLIGEKNLSVKNFLLFDRLSGKRILPDS